MSSDKKKAMPVLSFPCIQLMGVTVRELISDSALQAEGMKRVAERAPALASLSMMDLSVEAEAFGSKIHVADDEVPTVTGRIIESEDDARALKVPPVSAGRTALYVKALEKAVKTITDRPVFGGVIGPFSLAGRLTGMSEIMVNCYVEPDTVHIALEKASEFITNYILEFKRAGAHGVVMAEPAAGLLSPSLSDEFSSSYIKGIVEKTQSDGFIFIYHNCGPNTPHILGQLAAIGAGGYHFGDAVSMTDILKGMPSDRLVFGNVSPAREFTSGTPDSVYAATAKLLSECGKYKNFVVSSGCDIPPTTKWENIDAFFRAVDDYCALEPVSHQFLIA